MAVRVSELRGSECCPVIGQIQVASPRWDNITSPETELTSRWCSNSRTFVEPMSEAKQMTAAQATGAASHTMVVFLHRRASWPQTSIEKALFDVEYSRVLVFQGGVIECSSRMTGNCQVRFLEGWPPAMGAGYSAGRREHSHSSQPDCLHALLVLSVAGPRPAAGVVQVRALPIARGD